jgi:hypothetical protein
VSGQAKEHAGAERRYQRASCEFPAQMSWGTISHRCTVMVISIGGCYVASNVLVPRGEDVEASILMAEGERPVVCIGTVVWVSKRGMKVRWDQQRSSGFAMEFKRIYPEDRARIDDYVRKQNRLYKTIDHELKKAKPDRELVKELFKRVRPGESTHTNHIRKVCREELRHFRLRR